jgi:hypothetical protein
MPDEKCQSILAYIPFLGLHSGGNMQQGPATTRLLEAAIMSIVAVVATYVLVIPRIEERLEALKVQQTEIKEDIRQIKRDLYTPRASIQRSE